MGRPTRDSDKAPNLEAGGLTVAGAALPPRHGVLPVVALGCLIAAAFIIARSGLLLASGEWDRDRPGSDSAGAIGTHAAGPACLLPQVPPSLPPAGFHPALRSKLLHALNDYVPEGECFVVYLLGGEQETHFYADTDLSFWQESNFFYLSGIPPPLFPPAAYALEPLCLPPLLPLQQQRHVFILPPLDCVASTMHFNMYSYSR